MGAIVLVSQMGAQYKKEESLSKFMKGRLQMEAQQYAPFDISTHRICLKHIKSLWKYLEEAVMAIDNNWDQAPEHVVMIYRMELPEELKQALTEYESRTSNKDVKAVLDAWRAA